MRRLSPLLVVAFAMRLPIELTRIGAEIGGHAFGASWELANSAMWDMFVVLLAYGLVDLSRRSSGPAAIAARIAGLLFAALLATETAYQVMGMLDSHAAWIFDLEAYTYAGGLSLAAICLAVAAWPRARVNAIVGLVVCLLAVPPNVVNLYGWLGLGDRGGIVLWMVLGMAHVVGLLVLVVGASDGVETPRPELAMRGFALAAAGLTLRVVAAGVSVVLALAAMSAASFSIMKFALFGGLAVNLVSLGMVGIGALQAARSALDGMPRYAAALAAVGSLWCAGVLLEQLPQLYQLLYGDRGGGEDRLQALSIAMPIVVTISGAVLAAAIAGLARARNNQELARRAGSAGMGYVVLMLASVGIQSVMVEGAGQGGAVFILFAVAGCALVAQLMLSKVCHLASESVSQEPGLPRAVATLEGSS